MKKRERTGKSQFLSGKGKWLAGVLAAGILGGAGVFLGEPAGEAALDGDVIIFDQGIGMGLNKEDGSLYPMDKLAADRPTGLFLKIDADALEQTGSTPTITITGNGEAKQYAAGDYLVQQEVLTFEGAQSVKWDAGDYHARVQFESGDVLEQDVSFRDMKSIRVLVVPISALYSGQLQEIGKLDETLDDYTRKVYPLGDEDLEWIVYENENLVLEEPEYDVDTVMGRYRVWRMLSDMQDDKDEYDLILGVLAQNMKTSEDKAKSTVTGFTFGKTASVISMEDTSPAVTVAHEIGHCYGLGDEYENGTFSLETNMVPYGMSGFPFGKMTEKVSGTCPYIKGGAADKTQSSGTLVGSWNLPYDILSSTLIDREMTSLMGLSGYSEEEYWVTTDIWTALYDKLAQ